MIERSKAERETFKLFSDHGEPKGAVSFDGSAEQLLFGELPTFDGSAEQLLFGGLPTLDGSAEQLLFGGHNVYINSVYEYIKPVSVFILIAVLLFFYNPLRLYI